MTVLLNLIESFFISSFKLLMPDDCKFDNCQLNAKKALLPLKSVPSKKSLGFRTSTADLEGI